MVRYSLIVLAGLCSAGSAAAAPWADSLFEGLTRDFGSVPRGPVLTHPFRLTNTSSVPVHIAGTRVSCGCVTATPLSQDLAPGQTTAILAQMDTRRFSGMKSVTIYVQFDRPRWEEVRLWVQANSRDDLVLAPDVLSFGHVKRGGSPVTTMNVTFLGNGSWEIVDVASDSNYIQTTLAELRREPSEVAYQLTARIRSDAPVGKWYSDVWLKTNNPTTPRVRVPLTVEIEAPLNVSPATVILGQMKVGGEAERKVIIRGAKPFRITAVQGTDDRLRVRTANNDSKPVHVLTVNLKADKAGDVSRSLKVLTDMDEEAEIEFQAQAKVLP